MGNESFNPGLIETLIRENRPEMLSEGGFIEKAKRAVWETFYRTEGSPITYEDVFVVWFCKTLQNWKALVSTNAKDDYYYEITYNGNKRETYVDAYKKSANVVIPD